MGKFKDKMVMVTGAGCGIGYELCREFAAEGAVVALNDIKESLANEAAVRINEALGREAVISYCCDVADVEALRSMVAQFVNKVGRLDVMVANAGLTALDDFLTFTPEAFDRLTSVNLRGSYFTAQAAARTMIEKKISGRIILTSSITASQVFTSLGAYGVTKAGIRQMARVLGVELGKYDITVNAVSPGVTLTERILDGDPDSEAKWATVTPTGRVAHVEDIAAAVLFLASPEARHINGQTLEVDGGWTTVSRMPLA